MIKSSTKRALFGAMIRINCITNSAIMFYVILITARNFAFYIFFFLFAVYR
jgi:hypothetical protein